MADSWGYCFPVILVFGDRKHGGILVKQDSAILLYSNQSVQINGWAVAQQGVEMSSADISLRVDFHTRFVGQSESGT